MSMIRSKHWIGAIAAAVVVAYVAFSAYDSSMIRRGGMALLCFQAIDQAVLAEAKLLVVITCRRIRMICQKP